MLPLARFLVGVGPRQTEHVGEESFGQAMPAHNRLGEESAVGGEPDPWAAGLDQAIGLHLLDHLRHRGAGDLEAIGDTGLDDPHVSLGQLEDRLAILLEGGMPFRALVLGHQVESTKRRWLPLLDHCPNLLVRCLPEQPRGTTRSP